MRRRQAPRRRASASGTPASTRKAAALPERATDALPALCRVVLVPREIEGIDAPETRALDASAEVDNARLSRARAALRGSWRRS